ncbi:MAG: hypothetical protein WAU33_04030 [Candidatus Binataceae bacterium]
MAEKKRAEISAHRFRAVGAFFGHPQRLANLYEMLNVDNDSARPDSRQMTQPHAAITS